MRIGINAYLVTLVRAFDSRPVGIFATRAEAVAFAERVRATGEADTPEPAGRPTLLGRVRHVQVVEFRDGRPVVAAAEKGG